MRRELHLVTVVIEDLLVAKRGASSNAERTDGQNNLEKPLKVRRNLFDGFAPDKILDPGGSVLSSMRRRSAPPIK